MKIEDRSDKFTYEVGDIKVIKAKKKPVKESYSSFAEFLFEKEEKFVASTMRWITIKDERDRNQHILIKKKDGTVIAGMGGEHTGEKLKDVFKELGDKRDEIEKKEEKKKSPLLVKGTSEMRILDKAVLKKYVTAFKKDAIAGKEYHEVMSINDKEITSEERQALEYYTGSSYSTMNKLLRTPEYYDEHPDYLSDSSKQKHLEWIENCHSALKKHKSTEAVVTYRGITHALMKKLSGLESGDIITDDGFASTSTSRKTAESFASKKSGGYIMTVLIPKGSQAASVKKLSWHGNENEVLINKKARFQVKGVDHENQEMIVELLPHED